MNLRRIISFTVLLLLPLTAAHAQRTAPGEQLATLSIGTTLSGVGLEGSYGQYLLRSYWCAGLAFHDRQERDLPSGDRVHFPRVEARGAFLWRLAGTYSRSLSLYGGADAFIGLELLDLGGALSAPTLEAYHRAGFRDCQFIYGATPRAELECFLFPTVALTALVRVPFTFATLFPLTGWEASLGLRLNF